MYMYACISVCVRLRCTSNVSLQNAVSADTDDGLYSSYTRSRTMINIGSTKSRLVISCMTPEQAGEYTCVADTPPERIATSTQVSVGK